MNATKLIPFPLPQPPVASLMLVRHSGQSPGDAAWAQVTQRLKLCVAFDTAEPSRKYEVPIQRAALPAAPVVKHHRELRLAMETAEPASRRGWGINE